MTTDTDGWITVEETADERHRRRVEAMLTGHGLEVRSPAPRGADGVALVQVLAERFEDALLALEELDEADG